MAARRTGSALPGAGERLTRVGSRECGAQFGVMSASAVVTSGNLAAKGYSDKIIADNRQALDCRYRLRRMIVAARQIRHRRIA